MQQEGVYCFNSVKALELAKEHTDALFYYDGALVSDAPSNCINVPVNDFYTYFFKTTTPQVTQLNFDGTDFSSEIKQQITQSITQTISAVRNEKVQIVNTLLQADVDTQNFSAMLYFFLKELTENLQEDSSIVIIEKILKDLYPFLQKNSFIINNDSLVLIDKLLFLVQNKNNMPYIHLYFILQYLKEPSNKENIEIDYLHDLVQFEDLAQFFTFHKFVPYMFPSKRFKEYIEKLAPLIFSEDFFSLDEKIQKERIYKFFYCNNITYHFGEDFKIMFRYMYPVFLEAMQKEINEIVMYIYYPLQYSWNGVSQTQEELAEFNNKVEIPLEQYIKNTVIPAYNIKPNHKKFDPNKKKIKVAFLQERLIKYSIQRVFYSLMKVLAQNPDEHYEFIVYDLNFMELLGSHPDEVAKIKALGFKYVDLHQKFYNSTYALYPLMDKMLKVRQQIIDDDIDILIGMHSRAEYNFLFTTRTAPKQIYWSHGNHQYNLKNIDSRITHIETYNRLKEKYPFYVFSIIQYYTEHLKVSDETIQQERLKYPEKSLILGTIGRLNKIDNTIFLDTLTQILQQNPNVIYIAAGPGDNKHIINTLRVKGVIQQVYFPGHVNAALYDNIIDIFLNTFPLVQGESLNEFMATGKVFISLVEADSFWIEKQEEKLRKYLYPYSYEKYIEYTTKLIQDPSLRNKVSKAFQEEYQMMLQHHSTKEQFIKSVTKQP